MPPPNETSAGEAPPTTLPPNINPKPPSKKKSCKTLNAFIHNSNIIAERVFVGDVRSSEEHIARARITIERFQASFDKSKRGKTEK